MVAAAGNLGRNGYSTVLSPGDSPHAITVGAMKTEETYPRSDDLIASYSSKGPTYIDLTVKPDVVAPGNLVVSLLAPGSTLETEYPENVVGPSYYSPSATGPAEYMRLSGTSMATPVVSGTVALMLQKNPALTPDTVKARLMKTAGKTFPVSSTATDPTTGLTYTSFYDAFTIGAGYVDAAAALANYEETYFSSVSPTASYNPSRPAGLLRSSVIQQSGNGRLNGLRPPSGAPPCSRTIAWPFGTLPTPGDRAASGAPTSPGAPAALRLPVSPGAPAARESLRPGLHWCARTLYADSANVRARLVSAYLCAIIALGFVIFLWTLFNWRSRRSAPLCVIF